MEVWISIATFFLHTFELISRSIFASTFLKKQKSEWLFYNTESTPSSHEILYIFFSQYIKNIFPLWCFSMHIKIKIWMETYDGGKEKISSKKLNQNLRQLRLTNMCFHIDPMCFCLVAGVEFNDYNKCREKLCERLRFTFFFCFFFCLGKIKQNSCFWLWAQ